MSLSNNGLNKLMEECGEIIQAVCKYNETGDKKHLENLQEEIADTQAAMKYVIEKLNLNKIKIGQRRTKKYRKFTNWVKLKSVK